MQEAGGIIRKEPRFPFFVDVVPLYVKLRPNSPPPLKVDFSTHRFLGTPCQTAWERPATLKPGLCFAQAKDVASVSLAVSACEPLVRDVKIRDFAVPSHTLRPVGRGGGVQNVAWCSC